MSLLGGERSRSELLVVNLEVGLFVQHSLGLREYAEVLLLVHVIPRFLAEEIESMRVFCLVHQV